MLLFVANRVATQKDLPVYELSVELTFAASHQLRGYEGKCSRLHGHNWKVRLKVQGRELNAVGMLMDFVELKQLLEVAIAPLDHRHLNEIPPFEELNPTSENVARYVSGRIANELPEGISVAAVSVWENERCSATYLPEDDEMS